ncbi:vitamin K epoxide reductase family protein [Aeromicrobium sp.]|uniref:vitamin K epoxide reductase family protein n=1 Tax=Aeromicrobium sp. TaxID=1871063 RepID=UPI0030C15A56
MTQRLEDVDVRTEPGSDRGLGWLLTLGGAIGLLSAAILIIEKINLLENPKGPLACDLNPIVGCGSVINTDEASVFGFPNPLLGVAGFAIVITLGVLLLARQTLPSFVWIGLQAGVTFGIGLVTWLQFQSIYDLNALCPYCMVVWAVTIPIFVWVTARNLRAFAPASPVTRFVSDWTLLVNILWYVAVVAAIWFQFGSDLWA